MGRFDYLPVFTATLPGANPAQCEPQRVASSYASDRMPGTGETCAHQDDTDFEHWADGFRERRRQEVLAGRLKWALLAGILIVLMLAGGLALMGGL